jgi:hypothetical protein
VVHEKVLKAEERPLIAEKCQKPLIDASVKEQKEWKKELETIEEERHFVEWGLNVDRDLEAEDDQSEQKEVVEEDYFDESEEGELLEKLEKLRREPRVASENVKRKLAYMES